MTDDFSIQSASCDCLQKSCYHIGAIAFHSGFKTPIFSQLPLEEYKASNTTVDDGNTHDPVVTILHNKNEIEFIDLKVQQNEDSISEVFTSEVYVYEPK